MMSNGCVLRLEPLGVDVELPSGPPTFKNIDFAIKDGNEQLNAFALSIVTMLTSETKTKSV